MTVKVKTSKRQLMDMKRCYSCKQNKPFSEFYRNCSNPDGYQRQCKECCHEYKNSKEGRKARQQYIESSKGKQAMCRSTQKQKRKYPERIKAMRFLNHAIRDGRIYKPQQCTFCGKKGRVEGHHHKGYTEDHYLDVFWVCAKCHKQIHKNSELLEKK